MTQYFCKDPTRDFKLEVARGRIEDFEHFHLMSYNDDVGSSEEFISPVGDLTIPTSKVTTVDIYSSSTDDDGDPTSNTGAQTIVINYLDDDFAEQTKTITMNGTSKVEWTSADFYRFQSAYVATSGTGNTNAGNIEITDAGNTLKYGYIDAGDGCSQCGIYTVPAGKTLYLKSLNANGAVYDDSVDIILYSEATHHTSHVKLENQWMYLAGLSVKGTSSRLNLDYYKIPEKTTIYMTGTATTGGEVVYVGLVGKLVSNVD